VIEAKFRITARLVEGNSADIVDFLYVLTSTDKTMRLQDYLPNTTLESTVSEDQIEITDASETSQATGIDAHVVYKPFALSGTHSQGTKKSLSSHYKQIASKDLVLASGTTNREHGVFFRLRPSRAASLEGAKEFTFLATVKKGWRGDLCTVSCAARATKTSLISTSVVAAGGDQAQVGMYLAGDIEASNLAEDLRRAQENHLLLLRARPPKDNVLESFSTQAVSIFTGKKPDPHSRREVVEAGREVTEIESRLKQLTR
jgi:hypothetical protein